MEEVLPAVCCAPRAQGVEVVVSSAVVFLRRTADYVREVRSEVRKVTWPTVSDLRRTTIVITLFVIAVGIVIGIMDVVASKVLIDFLGGLFR